MELEGETRGQRRINTSVQRRGLNFLLTFADEDRARRIAEAAWNTIEEYRALVVPLTDAARLEPGLLSRAARFDPRFFTPNHEADDE